MTMQDNIDAILEKIETARQKAGTASVRLVAVSKTRTVEEIRQAFQCGIREFGENRVQEAIPKVEQAGPDITWHLVGHLQGNKANKAAAHFAWVQSLEKIDTAVRLGSKAVELGAEACSLEDIFIRSNVVSLHTPWLRETE